MASDCLGTCFFRSGRILKADPKAKYLEDRFVRRAVLRHVCDGGLVRVPDLSLILAIGLGVGPQRHPISSRSRQAILPLKGQTDFVRHGVKCPNFPASTFMRKKSKKV